jgi:hypothetical protein
LIRNATQEALSELQARFPKWHIWTVHKAVGGIIWCAKREDTLINEDSPSGLAVAITAASRPR